MDTTDLTSYYPGYDDYCEPKEYVNLNENPNDDVIEEILINGKESD